MLPLVGAVVPVETRVEVLGVIKINTVVVLTVEVHEEIRETTETDHDAVTVMIAIGVDTRIYPVRIPCTMFQTHK